MYQPRVSSVATPGSANRSQRGSTTKVSSRLCASKGGYPFCPGITPQRLSQSFNRSLQTSQIIEETSNYAVENYGLSLPVLVTEVLTVPERSADITVKLCESGWAWLVCSRRLFVWKYKNVSGSKIPSHCRELTLPPSDLAHKAELVSVFTPPESQVPSAIAVSPEGTIRYWPSILHEGASVETSAELHGQECYSLTNAQPLGCILATTTSTLMIVSPALVGGQNVVLCRHLKVPHGMLAGISRKVSSFIFGSMPTQSPESKLVKVLVTDGEADDEKILYVLAGNNLQKWELTLDETDKLLFECDLDRFVKENMVEALWGRDVYHVNQIQTWLIDMQLTRKSLVVLAAGVNPQGSLQLCYAFAALDITSNDAPPPSGLSSFSIAKHAEQYSETAEDSLLGYRFLLSRTVKNTAFMYGERTVFCFSVTCSADEPDRVEFTAPTDKILGAGTCEGVPLFFLVNHGIVSLTPILPQHDISIRSSPEEQVSVLNEGFSFSEDFMAQENISKTEGSKFHLKTAFLEYCKQNQMASQSIVDTLFPPMPSSQTDPALNETVIAISENLIDDFPASDPRWAESVSHGGAGPTSSSLITLHQLDDKQKAHEVYIGFLKGVGLWSRMSVVTARDMPIPTRLMLCEHAEKIASTIALHNLRSQYGTLIDQAIKAVLQFRNEHPKGKLTTQDLFFRQISDIQQIVPALMECVASSPDQSSSEYVNNVIAVNTIVQTVLQEACHFRNSRTALYPIPASEPDTEYLPWTASSGNQGLRTLLIKQHSATVEVSVQGVKDVNIRGKLYQQLVDLADLILDGYRIQLESISNAGDAELYRSVMQRYQADRYSLIKPLLEAQQHDRAAALAEKYCDFKILVELCEETANQERLQRYMAQFADKDFADYVFKWYLEEGKRGKLLSEPIMHQGQLRRFLDQHQSLSWLHDLHTNNFGKAQSTLKDLAISEKEILARKKTLLSLSKLSALASDRPSDHINGVVDETNRELELIMHQEMLPASVLESFGFDPEKMKVMSPSELIELYISEENVGGNEFDFKKALDLLQYVDKTNPEVDCEATKLHIWCSAVRRDSWTDLDTDNPVESSSGTTFFKTIDLIFAEGSVLDDYLPFVDNLLQAEELGFLKNAEEVQFLIRATYEHFHSL